MERGDVQKPPLSAITDAFEDLDKFFNSPTRKKNGVIKDEDDNDEQDLRLDRFCEACSFVSILFGCLGLAFRFAELEYVSKVRDLMEASKRYKTLPAVIEVDIKNNTVKSPGSHTRNLRRVRQGLDLVRAIFEQFISTEEYSLKDAATTAYTQVCAPFHTWTVRTAVYAGMYTLPTRDQLLFRLSETDQSAEKKMKRYIQVSRVVIEYIDKLFTSRNISLDW